MKAAHIESTHRWFVSAAQTLNETLSLPVRFE
jgi:hypothetical protein